MPLHATNHLDVADRRCEPMGSDAAPADVFLRLTGRGAVPMFRRNSGVAMRRLAERIAQPVEQLTFNQ